MKVLDYTKYEISFYTYFANHRPKTLSHFISVFNTFIIVNVFKKRRHPSEQGKQTSPIIVLIFNAIDIYVAKERNTAKKHGASPWSKETKHLLS